MLLLHLEHNSIKLKICIKDEHTVWTILLMYNVMAELSIRQNKVAHWRHTQIYIEQLTSMRVAWGIADSSLLRVLYIFSSVSIIILGISKHRMLQWFISTFKPLGTDKQHSIKNYIKCLQQQILSTITYLHGHRTHQRKQHLCLLLKTISQYEHPPCLVQS